LGKVKLFCFFNTLRHKTFKSKDMSVEKVLAAMTAAGKPVKAGEIAELAGLDKKEVDKAIKVLKTEEKITSPKVCFYEVKR
jgi:chromosome segregation and condensation protein ScpB